MFDGRFAHEAARDDADDCGEDDLGSEEDAALFEDVGRGLDLESRAEADEEHGEQRCQAGEERAGERAEELACVRGEGMDDRADAKRHQHHAAGNLLDGFLDGNRH